MITIIINSNDNINSTNENLNRIDNKNGKHQCEKSNNNNHNTIQE